MALTGIQKFQLRKCRDCNNVNQPKIGNKDMQGVCKLWSLDKYPDIDIHNVTCPCYEQGK